jgi:hypothetical protein
MRDSLIILLLLASTIGLEAAFICQPSPLRVQKKTQYGSFRLAPQAKNAITNVALKHSPNLLSYTLTSGGVHSRRNGAGVRNQDQADRVQNGQVAILLASFAVLMSKGTGTKFLRAVMMVVSLSITSDLVLVTNNKRVGEGSKHHNKKLSRVRSILYGISVPLLFLMPMSRYTLASAALVKSVGCITFGVVLHEFLDWGHGLIWLPLLLSVFVPRSNS